MGSDPASEGVALLRQPRVYEEMENCIQCGFCLPACPTYRVLQKETHSPRGRIALAKAVADGELPLARLAAPLSLCLGCRACEVVCPAGVEYGRIFEAGREALVRSGHARGEGKPLPWLERAVLRHLFFRPAWLRLVGRLVRWEERLGLSRRLARWLPAHLGEFARALPPLRADRMPRRVLPRGKVKGRVALFRGCVMDALFAETNRNTARLLAAAGYEVVVPEGQVCCGALHAHAGMMDEARALARRNAAVFREAGVDLVVNNAGGCGAFLKEYGELLGEEGAFLAQRSRDVSEVLAGSALPLTPEPSGDRVTYQDSCHLRHVQRVVGPPRELLRARVGKRFVEMRESDRCCGSAGIYSLTQYDTSMRILDEKMQRVQETGARLVVTSNPGCLLQMRLGVVRAGLEGRVEVAHLADVLAAGLPADSYAEEG